MRELAILGQVRVQVLLPGKQDALISPRFTGVALVERCARIHPDLCVACGDDDDGILQARSAAEPRQSRASASRAFDGGVCLCARAVEFTST